MTRRRQDSLLALVQSFFQQYLRGVRGASDHTIRAYRDTLRLFFHFLDGRRTRSVADVTLNDITADAVLAFLQHVETQRGNAVATRNCRLVAIRSFVRHLLRHDLTRAEQYGRILEVGSKRAPQRAVTYLEPDEARLVVTVEGQSRHAERDRALLLLLYNTGARVSEAVAICPRSLRLDRLPQVRVVGKGRKERYCPLWPETAAALRRLVRAEAPDEPIFRSARGVALTRDGVAYILRKYVRRATEQRPELRGRRITPHVLRHSCAVALLQAGVDVTVIRDYLGHASVATTSRYITSNLQMKRHVLDAFWKRAGLSTTRTRPWRPSRQVLEVLRSV